MLPTIVSYLSAGFICGLWRYEWGARYWSNGGNTSDSDGLHFNTKVWQDSSWQDSSWGKIFYWIAQLACDQTLGWEIAFLCCQLFIYLFREKGGKKAKNQSGLEMRQCWLQADKCVVTWVLPRTSTFSLKRFPRFPHK